MNRRALRGHAAEAAPLLGALGMRNAIGRQKATAFVRDLAQGQATICDLTRERIHEWQVGVCYCDGRDLGAELIKAELEQTAG